MNQDKQSEVIDFRLETGKLDAGSAIPMILHCPICTERHIDEGEFAEVPHHTHACQGCGFVWRPAKVNTHGVRFLPGYANVKRLTDAEIAPFAHAAAVAWCGQKERETFREDELYFEHNWRSLPGMRDFAEKFALSRPTLSTPSEGVIERLRAALEAMVEVKCDYMIRNLLGDPEAQHTIKTARAALAKARGE